jgi:nifR3 family TIM-barrel protein
MTRFDCRKLVPVQRNNSVSLLKCVHIRDLVITNNLFLAPLAGVGDNAFRIMGRRFGAGLTFSEMVSANGIVRGNQKTLELMHISDVERPLGIQLFGSDPAVMADAAGMAAGHKPDLVDINCGCSVRKVLKTGSGAALLADPEHLHRVVRGCVEASPVPVSVKMRLGLQEQSINVVETGLAVQEAGASLLTLHPRTAAAKYTGTARWEYIARMKESLSIPVCGNGDITIAEHAVAMMEQTGCDAVMVGRGAIGNPWLLRDIVHALKSYPETVRGEGQVPAEYTAEPSHPSATDRPAAGRRPSVSERVGLAIEHLDLAISFKGEKRAVRDMKRHLHRYIRGMRDASWVRERLFRAETGEQIRAQLRTLIH